MSRKVQAQPQSWKDVRLRVVSLWSALHPHPRQVVASFLKAAEGVAHRWIDTRKGTLLLQMAPYQPDSVRSISTTGSGICGTCSSSKFR